MTDFDYDVLQKKRIARGAAHQKKGFKSRKCTLPHESLTPAQMKKLNGPCETYAVNRPMSWETFKHLPVDLQQDHIDFIQDRFGIGVNTISAEVFGLSASALRFHAERRGLKFKPKPGTRPADGMLAVRQWLGRPAPSEGAEQEEAEVEPNRQTDDEPAEGPVVLDNARPRSAMPGLSDLPELLFGGEVHMSGSARELLPRLVALLSGNDAHLDVRFTYTTKKEDAD